MKDLLYFYQHLPEHINPVAFRIGIFSMDYYSLMYLVAFAIVYFLLRWRISHSEFPVEPRTKNQEPRTIILDFMFFAILGVLVGGRLGYVLFYNFPYYLAHPLEAFLPIQATSYGLQVAGFYGMSFHGGLIGVVLAVLLFTKKYKIDFWRWADFVVPAIPAGYFFGRIGNFFNGELYGRATQKFWGMYFPQDPLGLLRHPSQLYEAFFEGLALFILLWIFRNRLRALPAGRQVTGYGLCVYLVGYGFSRFFIEFFRDPDPQIGLVFGGLTLGQLFSLAMTAAGAIIFFVRERKNRYNSANE
jgi:phosphatidylglycerol---prolipoprotein diacylglyceryl transferase